MESVVADGELCRGPAVQAPQQFSVGAEHPLFVLMAGNLIIDVSETEGLGVLLPAEEDTVLPDPPDGDGVMDGPGDPVGLPLLLNGGFYAFHLCINSFSRSLMSFFISS